MLLASALCALVPGMATVAAAEQDGIAVADAWSRPAMAGRTGIVYLTVTDSGAPDRLVGASSPVAAKATLHESIDDHGVMKMRSVQDLPVQPGKPLKLAPNGYHIMLEGLKQPLQVGQSFPVTLSFAHAGKVTATAMVQQGAGGMAMDHGAMGQGTMGQGVMGQGVMGQGVMGQGVMGGMPAQGPAHAAMPGMTMGAPAQH
jgi:hypothetical protein